MHPLSPRSQHSLRFNPPSRTTRCCRHGLGTPECAELARQREDRQQRDEDLLHQVVEAIEQQRADRVGDRQPRGDQRARDAAYHQGTVWPWLLGPYGDVLLRLTGDPARLASLLAPFRERLRTAEAGAVGTIGEIADAAPPFAPKGCVAQAWSVSELLRLAALPPPS